jgi:hypothetical protein
MTGTLEQADLDIPAEPRPSRLPAWTGQTLVWVMVIGLVAGPFLPLLYSSVRSKPIYLPGGAFTLGAYRTLFADPAYWTAAENTVIFAVATTAIAVAGGTVLAILCQRTNLPGRRAYGLLAMAPIVIPPEFPQGLVVRGRHDGPTATVAVRPEEIEIVRSEEAGTGGGPGAEGTVLDASYLGDHYEYRVAVGQTELSVRAQRPLEPGPVWLRIPPGVATFVAEHE